MIPGIVEGVASQRLDDLVNNLRQVFRLGPLEPQCRPELPVVEFGRASSEYHVALDCGLGRTTMASIPQCADRHGWSLFDEVDTMKLVALRRGR